MFPAYLYVARRACSIFTYMMRKPKHATELTRKKRIAIVFFCLGIALPALATTSSFPPSSFEVPPPLPLPDLAGAAGGDKAPALAVPPLPNDKGPEDAAKVAPLPQTPEKAEAVAPKTDNFGKPATAPEGEALADLPPASPESSEEASPITDLSKATYVTIGQLYQTLIQKE